MRGREKRVRMSCSLKGGGGDYDDRIIVVSEKLQQTEYKVRLGTRAHRNADRGAAREAQNIRLLGELQPWRSI